MDYVIFDMDGVIIDSEPTYMKRLKDFCDFKGYGLNDDFFNKTCGSNSKDCFEMFTKAVPNFYETDELFKKDYRKFHKENSVDYTKIVNKEIYSLLKELKEKKKTIILASSSAMKNIENVLTQLDIIRYFDLIVSGEDFTRSKPDPEIYNFIKRKYNRSEEDFIVIEDSEYGITAAKDAGMRVIAKIDDRFGYNQRRADFFINTLDEALAHIF